MSFWAFSKQSHHKSDEEQQRRDWRPHFVTHCGCEGLGLDCFLQSLLPLHFVEFVTNFGGDTDHIENYGGLPEVHLLFDPHLNEVIWQV